MDLPVPLGHVIGNKYRVDSLVGSGGMGVVAAGYHLELEQPIAIKFLGVEKEVCAESAERFRREARTAARIHSEHAVKVFDSGVVGEGIPYMVMELLEGNDLGQELARQGPLPVALGAHYLLQAIDAIAEAHAMGVVHRDLKPGNLFLARGADGTRAIKVLDFGISKSVARSSDIVLTRTASMIGSPLYMSPEQMRSARDVDARSDIWSLGAILYELVSGEPPFPADSIPELCVAVMNDSVRPISRLVPAAPRGLDALLARCLNRSLSERFASVADLADALVEFAPASRRYAERARRLISTPSVRATLLPETLLPETHAVSYASDYPTRLASTASVDERIPSRSGATQTAWGHTGRGAMSKRSIPFVVGGALVLGVCAVLAWEALTPAGRDASLTSTSASAGEANPTAAEIAALKPAPDEAVPPPEPLAAEPALPAESAAAPAAASESSASVSTAALASARQGTPHPNTFSAPRPRTSPALEPSSGKPQAITDFGGRRY